MDEKSPQKNQGEAAASIVATTSIQAQKKMMISTRISDAGDIFNFSNLFHQTFFPQPKNDRLKGGKSQRSLGWSPLDVPPACLCEEIHACTHRNHVRRGERPPAAFCEPRSERWCACVSSVCFFQNLVVSKKVSSIEIY